MHVWVRSLDPSGRPGTFAAPPLGALPVQIVTVVPIQRSTLSAVSAELCALGAPGSEVIR